MSYEQDIDRQSELPDGSSTTNGHGDDAEDGPGSEQPAKDLVNNGAESGDSSRKMFVGGLNRGTTDVGLRDYFEQFGEIESCVIKCDPATERSRGFGFVTFKDRSSVEKVLSTEITHMLDERKIDPKLAVPFPKNRTRKIFVGGLPSELPDSALREHFGDYGTVDDVELPIDRQSGVRKGFGFISFEKEDSVEAALKETFHKIGEYTVEVKRAVAKDSGTSAGHRGRLNSSRSMGGHVANGHGMMAAAAYGMSSPAQYAAYSGGYHGQAQAGYGAYGQMVNPYAAYAQYAGYPYYAYNQFAGMQYGQQVQAGQPPVQGQQAFTAYTAVPTPESSSNYGPVRTSTNSSQGGYRPY